MAKTGKTHIFQNCQFFQCGTNVEVAHDDSNAFENVLSAQCGVMVIGTNLAVNGQNMSVDGCNAFALTNSTWGGYSGGLTNCILTGVTNLPGNFSLSCTTVAGDSNGVFQTVGAGGYYLVDGSTNRNAGTTNIDPVLLADLQQTTTYPPLVANWDVTNAVTLFPQAQRDTDTPDLGYHYGLRACFAFLLSAFFSQRGQTVALSK